MRDLFSGCVYVRTYVLVTLRNVNVRLRSECQFALTLIIESLVFIVDCGEMLCLQ